MRNSARGRSPYASVAATLVLALALAGVSLAGAPSAKAAATSGRAKATVTFHGSTYKFTGGRCKRILDGFSVTIGKLAGARYFTLQNSRTLKKGTYKDAVLGLHVNGKYYNAEPLTLTITNQARKGTFFGKFKNQQTGASAGPFKGSFSC